MFKRYLHDIEIAFESIIANQTRSFLTALGIIFGVAAVISMLAIGKGAKQEILEQIKMVGVNNIIITPVVAFDENSSDESSEGESEKNKYSPGLTLEDVKAIEKTLPTIERISPEIVLSSFAVQNGKQAKTKLYGVDNSYFEIFNINLAEGKLFSDDQIEYGVPVCIVGANIKVQFFNNQDPIGQYIKFGDNWLKIIGVLEKSNFNMTGFEKSGLSVTNDNLYTPVKTMLMRYENRAIKNQKQTSSIRIFGGGMRISNFGGSANQQSSSNYNQLDKIVVQVKETEQLTSSTEILSRMLFRRHQEVKDFEITVPELLLKQQQKTKDIFNLVLGAIASISLIVGGIGIMNIMFASVMERIKEIGTRLAIGAKKKDIVAQFLSEAIIISVSGGLTGVVLGVILAQLITHFFDIKTIVSIGSIVVAFGVSAAVGVIFGYSPAKKASERDPIESLRYE